MAKEICEDCGRVFEGGPYAFICPNCRKKRQIAAGKKSAEIRRKKREGAER